MSTDSPTVLIRSLLRPALLVFALPAVGLAFGLYAPGHLDETVQEAIVESAKADPGLDATQRAEAVAWAESVRASEVCQTTDPELAQLRSALVEPCGDYPMFTAIVQGSILAVGLGLLAGAAGAGCAWAAWRRRQWQIPAFRLGWNLLRLLSALIVTVQGLLLIALSYFVTALFFNFYVVKLIFIAGAVLVVALFVMIKALFQKIDLSSQVEGRVIDEAQAPEFWQRLRTLAGQIGTDPPDHLVGGIDDSFFVSEVPLVVGQRRLSGRNLFVSLSLLRGMRADEAEAVLCHELAHFSGGDTAHSRTLAPMLARYQHYLGALQSSPLTIPLFHLMLAFWGAFHLALARTSRERELQADRVAAEHTSPEAIARSLVKVTAWSTFRHQIEAGLFGQDQALAAAGIRQQVREGFAAFSASPQVRELDGHHTPHPMDSHPSNADRFASVGVNLPPERWGEVLEPEASDSWYHRIPVAEAVEAELWAEYEERFLAQQHFKVAVELSPTTPEELALVERFFPAHVFNDQAGEPIVDLNWKELSYAGWSVDLAQLRDPEVKESLGRKTLHFRSAGGDRHEVPLHKLADADGFLDALNRNYQRAQIAANKAGQKAGASA